MIGLRLGMWICYTLNCNLLKHIVSLTIISGSPFKHGKHRVSLLIYVIFFKMVNTQHLFTILNILSI